LRTFLRGATISFIGFLMLRKPCRNTGLFYLYSRMGWLELLKEFFGFGKAVADAVNKNSDSEAVKDAKFEMAKPRLTIQEKAKIFNRAKVHMDLNLRDSIDGYIDFACSDLDSEDKENLRKQLYGIYPEKRHKLRKFRL